MLKVAGVVFGLALRPVRLTQFDPAARSSPVQSARTLLTCALLKRVRQLVRDQAAPQNRVGSILTLTENHVASDRVGQGIHAARRGGCARVHVQSHARKVASEARLHQASGFRLEDSPWRSQHFVHDGWHFIERLGTRGFPLQRPFSSLALFAARFAFPGRAGCNTAGALALQHDS